MEIVVTQRIRRLEARANKAEELLKRVKPTKKVLANTILDLKRKVVGLEIREENALKALQGKR